MIFLFFSRKYKSALTFTTQQRLVGKGTITVTCNIIGTCRLVVTAVVGVRQEIEYAILLCFSLLLIVAIVSELWHFDSLGTGGIGIGTGRRFGIGFRAAHIVILFYFLLYCFADWCWCRLWLLVLLAFDVFEFLGMIEGEINYKNVQ
jgi:hypothetical protein